MKITNISRRRETIHAQSKLEHYDTIMEDGIFMQNILL